MQSQEIEFEEQHLKRIAQIACDLTGISLPDSKLPLVYSRLVRRVRALKLQGFDQYCALLVSDEGQSEREELFTALTTNVTGFFRERHHFEFLREKVFPGLGARVLKGDRVRLWSSACSSGQEAYCLAMAWLEACPTATGRDFRILASDIDPRILAKAKDAKYEANTIDQVEERYKKYFETLDSGKVTPIQQVRDLLSFRQLNLVHDWPFSGKFDVILCRNVAIYFDRDIQSVLWDRFAEAMTEGGHLLIGHSERLCGAGAAKFENCGVTTYVRTT